MIDQNLCSISNFSPGQNGAMDRRGAIRANRHAVRDMTIRTLDRRIATRSGQVRCHPSIGRDAIVVHPRDQGIAGRRSLDPADDGMKAGQIAHVAIIGA